MSKVTFEFDNTEEHYDITLCNSRYAMASMLDEIGDYARTLRKYEERESIPTEEVETRISDIIHSWFTIQDI